MSEGERNALWSEGDAQPLEQLKSIPPPTANEDHRGNEQPAAAWPLCSILEDGSAVGVSEEARQFPILAGYRIAREIGRGGMGGVYEAVEDLLGRRVAIKILPRSATHDPRQAQRFEREARAAGRLHNTNIVPVFGVSRQEDQHIYVMQFIEGRGLNQIRDELRRLVRPSAPMLHSTARSAETSEDGGSEPPVGSHHTDNPGPSAAAIAESLATGKHDHPSESQDRASAISEQASEALILTSQITAASPPRLTPRLIRDPARRAGPQACSGRGVAASPASPGKWRRRWITPIVSECSIAISSRQTCFWTSMETSE